MKEITMKDVTVVGMGYAGLTLAIALSKKGLKVSGFDNNTEIVEALSNGVCHIYEPGLEELLRKHLGENLFVFDRFPARPHDAVIICVSTPIDENKRADLSNLRAATGVAGENIDDETLIIIRSTIPVGTSRNVVLPILKKHRRSVRLAFCPERTIQGRAIEELERLPQVIGGLDEISTTAASALFEKLTDKIVAVSSLECAELVKLANNCHTDLLYSYGNEIALMTERLVLDALEVVSAANVDYPRPDVARPGFVGGGCLSKDPYLLIDSFEQFDYEPSLVRTARELNESIPFHVVRKFWGKLRELKNDVHKIFICGFAFKGTPITDDVRGSAVVPILEFLKQHSVELCGHDYEVKPAVVERFGITCTTIKDGFKDTDAVIFVNDHPDYRNIGIHRLIETMRRPAVILDCWQIFKDDRLNEIDGIYYGGIGHE